MALTREELQRRVVEEATRDLVHNPSYQVPESDQRRWGRWLMKYGPRIAAGGRWLLVRLGLRRHP